jgi:hypothetical protein
MAFHKDNRKAPNHKWTEEEIQLVKTLSAKGWKAEDIQQQRLPHLTERQITNKIYFERHKDEINGIITGSQPFSDKENSQENGTENEVPERKKRNLENLLGALESPQSRNHRETTVIRPEYSLSRLGIFHMHEGKNSVTIWLKQVPGMSVIFGPVLPFEVKVTIKPDRQIPTDIPFLKNNGEPEIVTRCEAGDFIFTIPTRNKLGISPTNANRMYYPSEDDKQWIIYNIKYESEEVTIFRD